MADSISGEMRPRVFISYARADGEQTAGEVRQLLEAQNISVWQDRTHMEGGHDWWLQIAGALDVVEFMVAIMTPAALESPIVRKEWRYARQQGVCIYPLKASSDLDFKQVPHWMSSVHWYDPAVEQIKFLRDLSRTHEKRYVPFLVNDLPADFVQRPRELAQLCTKLLNEKRDEPRAVIAALRGAAGYGKTTMAQALCHHEAIQEAFDDGILWVTLGEQPANLVGIVSDLIYSLSREKPTFDTLEAATGRLSELLAERDILLIIDDVWEAEHLKPFLQGGKRCARLITTRNEQVLPVNTECIIVDAMLPDEAVKLLLYGLEHAFAAEKEMSMIYELIRLAGKWPLLLKLISAPLRTRVNTHHQLLPEALRSIHSTLNKRGLVAFDTNNPQSRHQAVATTLSMSFELLSTDENARYKELALFPEDVDIPMATLYRLWKETGGLDEIDTEELCQKLYALSLLLDYNLVARTIRVHDVIRTYLRTIMKDTLVVFHQQFLDAYHCTRWSDLPIDEPYLWSHLVEHLIGAGRIMELSTTLHDGNYLATKTYLCQAYGVETDITLAEAYLANDTMLSLLKHVYRGIGHIFNQCTTLHELASTLQAYLAFYPDFIDICACININLTRPYLTAQHPLPGGLSPLLIRTLYNHTNGVNGCSISPDGQWIISCANDMTLKVWDVNAGKEWMALEGHMDWVSGCAISPDGKWIVSCSDDKTLKVWDSHIGKERMTLLGHDRGVNGCAISPDGKWIVSCSDDRTLKVWDRHTGKERTTLTGHNGGINGCAISPDGKWIVSCSDDRTLKVWDSHSENELATLSGHIDGVSGCVIDSSGNCIISCSWDGTLKAWNIGAGKELITLSGHSRGINGCAISPNGKWMVSCSDDKTLKIWDAYIGPEQITLPWHSGGVNGCVVSPSGKWFVSCSNDTTLKIWDASSGKEHMTLIGHIGHVEGCAINPSGEWIVSCSNDGMLKIWDVSTGKERVTLKGHTSYVEGCAISPSGEWIVSCSWDETLKIWDVSTGKERVTLKGHTSYVEGCAISPSGEWIVSCSNDGMLKIWDVSTGKERVTLKGHYGGVSGCAISPSGEWIVSCSWDNTLKVWDASMGEERFTLKGHTDWVSGCAISPDGSWILSCSHDGTLKIWDAQRGTLKASLHVDAPLWTCIISPDGEHILAGGSGGVYFLRVV